MEEFKMRFLSVTQLVGLALTLAFLVVGIYSTIWFFFIREGI
jgi:hypothetical protein